MKEDIAKQQALFDHEQEQAAYDRENETHEQEELKRLKDQLLAKFTTCRLSKKSPRIKS